MSYLILVVDGILLFVEHLRNTFIFGYSSQEKQSQELSQKSSLSCRIVEVLTAMRNALNTFDTCKRLFWAILA